MCNRAKVKTIVCSQRTFVWISYRTLNCFSFSTRQIIRIISLSSTSISHRDIFTGKILFFCRTISFLWVRRIFLPKHLHTEQRFVTDSFQSISSLIETLQETNWFKIELFEQICSFFFGYCWKGRKQFVDRSKCHIVVNFVKEEEKSGLQRLFSLLWRRRLVQLTRGVIISEVRVSKIQVRGDPEKLTFFSAFGVTRWIPKWEGILTSWDFSVLLV